MTHKAVFVSFSIPYVSVCRTTTLTLRLEATIAFRVMFDGLLQNEVCINGKSHSFQLFNQIHLPRT